VIQTLSDNCEKRFYFSGNVTFGFDEFDHAVIFGMFGPEYYKAVVAMLSAVKTQ
jgi:hypothetical protein